MSIKLRYFLTASLFGFGLTIHPAIAADEEVPAKPTAKEAMPSSAPIFTSVFTDFDGQPMPLSELKGKVVVLNFWATWCHPCRTEIPHLEEAHKTYGSRGVTFIGAAVEDQAGAVQDAAKANGITYTMAMVGKENGIALLQALGNKIAGLPFTIVLDRQGNIVATKLGILSPARLQKILDPLL